MARKCGRKRRIRPLRPLWMRKPHFIMPSAESPFITGGHDRETQKVLDRIDLRHQRRLRQAVVDRGGYD